jgi:hypothetical protein
VPDDDDEQPQEHDAKLIDLSSALGEAGHESEELGYADTPDTGPVLHAAEEKAERDLALDVARDQATAFPSD